jgi:hypothetical protein
VAVEISPSPFALSKFTKKGESSGNATTANDRIKKCNSGYTAPISPKLSDNVNCDAISFPAGGEGKHGDQKSEKAKCLAVDGSVKFNGEFKKAPKTCTLSPHDSKQFKLSSNGTLEF